MGPHILAVVVAAALDIQMAYGLAVEEEVLVLVLAALQITERAVLVEV
jgi:hypothetical protein